MKTGENFMIVATNFPAELCNFITVVLLREFQTSSA